MLRRETFAAFAIFAIATLAGCVDFSQDDGCVSDDECRYGRICSEVTGRCFNPDTVPDPIDNSEDPQPDADADADAGADVAPEPDTDPTPEPDAGRPDVSPTPDADAGSPDVEEPDAQDCVVVAHARARVQGATSWQDQQLSMNPLNAVLLDASQSTGDVVSYEWTILERPTGSMQRLLPSNSETNPRFFVDLIGTFRIQLTVNGRSDSGSWCQDTDTIRIEAVPGHDLHIQLVWDTPGDDDQTDTTGSDLDLHYLHPNGSFGRRPWDIFWQNPTADWGVVDEDFDDPNLDIDDTDGAGPENVTHNSLEDVEYEVGVLMTDHAELGPSFATIRIYYQGQLVYERRNQRMVDLGSFWHIAKIDGSGNVTNIDTLLDGFPFGF